MKGTTRTRPARTAKKRKLARATPAQIARQAGLILVAVAIWAGLLVAWLAVTGPDEPAVSESPPATEAVAVAQPTASPAPAQQLPTETAGAAATHTLPAPTEVPAEPPPAALPTEPPEATPSPTVLPTQPAASPGPTDTPPAGAPGVSFSEDVLPIFTSRCQRCHGGDRIEAGLDLLSYAAVMAGSEDGPVVIPGSSATSRLVESIVSGDMPKRAPRLPDSEIETVSTWVDEGALDN